MRTAMTVLMPLEPPGSCSRTMTGSLTPVPGSPVMAMLLAALEWWWPLLEESGDKRTIDLFVIKKHPL